ncbi:hypothetical protein GOODEAATRI_022402 [Goodea atripinnis]|uniref:Uncharacterized protein n=1 Tax=Goodea atripinnis TaxID=208336 RepID=A0ABV0PG61_9TELE
MRKCHYPDYPCRSPPLRQENRVILLRVSSVAELSGPDAEVNDDGECDDVWVELLPVQRVMRRGPESACSNGNDEAMPRTAACRLVWEIRGSTRRDDQGCRLFRLNSVFPYHQNFSSESKRSPSDSDSAFKSRSGC